MNEKGYLQNILFLDIETVGLTDDYTAIDERLKKQWLSNVKRKDSHLNYGQPVDQVIAIRLGFNCDKL